MWKEFCSSLGAQVSLSSGFHLQTNEHTERMNQPSVQYHPTNPPGAVNWHGLNTLTIHPLHLQLISHLLNHLCQPPLFLYVEGECSVSSVQEQCFVQTVQRGVCMPPKHFNLAVPSKCSNMLQRARNLWEPLALVARVPTKGVGSPNLLK